LAGLQSRNNRKQWKKETFNITNQINSNVIREEDVEINDINLISAIANHEFSRAMDVCRRCKQEELAK